MDWNQVYTIVAANVILVVTILGSTIALFLWARSEAREDQQELRQMIAADRKDFLQLIREIREDLHTFQRGMDDFHNRLIKIEMERKK